MRIRIPVMFPLLIFAVPAAAMNFQPGYWELALQGAGAPAQSYKRCLHDVRPQFDEQQQKYCKRLESSVKGNVMTSRVHCVYPTSELTSFEQITFGGDTLKGKVRVDVVKPRKRTVQYVMTGKLLSKTCPEAPAAATH